MPQEITDLGFSRLSLAPNVFDEEPPPLAGGTAHDATAHTDSGTGVVRMRPREGRQPRRAAASRSPARSRSASAADSAPLPAQIRQGAPRAASSIGAEDDGVITPSVIIDGTPYGGSLVCDLDQHGCGRRATRLDDPIPWNAALADIEDDGYARPRPESTLAPGIFGAGLTRGSWMQTSLRANSCLSGLPDGYGSRPHSIGGRSLFGGSVSGATISGTPLSAGMAAPGGPLSERVYVQTVIFGDPGTLSSALDTPATETSGTTEHAMARAWQRIANAPRALVSACREWAQRFFDWISALR